MEKESIRSYIEKLEEFEKQLNQDEIDDSPEFIGELDKLLKNLGSDIQQNYTPSLNINIKKLKPEAVIPTYSKDGDAGMDLTAVKIYHENANLVCETGLAMEIPYGYVGLLFPRSSVTKKSLCLANCVGVIDSGYRGEIKVLFKPTMRFPDEDYKVSMKYEVGERIAQIIILPYPRIQFNEVTELSNSERGEGGFGHTGI